MNQISELKKILNQNFDWNKHRLDCFSRMMVALFKVRTVNLSEMAVAFASKTEVASRYKRLQRFFRYFKFDYAIVDVWIFKLFLSNYPSKIMKMVMQLKLILLQRIEAKPNILKNL